jgi:hypothetical protein
LKLKYGDKIFVSYVDTRKTGVNKYFVVARVIKMGYNFPIVAINGHPKFAGGIDLEQIQHAIEEIIENK